MPRRGTPLFFLATVLSSGPLHAQDAAAALARAETAYATLTTLAASFEQTIINPLLGAPERSRGALYLERPTRFAMRFDEPAGDRLVADGEWLWAYTPSAAPGQVFRQPVPTSGATTPNLFAQFVERPRERYDVAWIGEETVGGVATQVVRLVPSVDGIPFRLADLAIDADGMLRKLSFVEATGQRREFLFSSIQRDVAITADEFVFEVPPGVRVLTP